MIFVFCFLTPAPFKIVIESIKSVFNHTWLHMKQHSFNYGFTNLHRQKGKRTNSGKSSTLHNTVTKDFYDVIDALFQVNFAVISCR